MADVTRYINTGSTAGGDGTTNATSGANRAYVSFSEWEAAEDGTSYNPGDIHTVYVTGIDDNGSGLININDWSVNVEIHVRANSGSECNARPQNAGLTSSNASRTILNYRPMNFYDFALMNTNGGNAIQMISSYHDMVVSGCYFEGNSGTRALIYNPTVDGLSITIQNTILNSTGGAEVLWCTPLSSGQSYDANVNSCGVTERFYAGSYTTLNFYNSWSNHTDFHLAGTGTVVNVEHSVSAENPAPSVTTDIDNTWNNDFTDYFEDEAGDDYNPTADATNLLDAGDTALSGTPAEDANGVTRSNPCDVGPFEYVAAGGTSIPVIQHHRQQQGASQ